MDSTLVNNNPAITGSQLDSMKADFLVFVRASLERELSAVTDLMAQISEGQNYWEIQYYLDHFQDVVKGYAQNKLIVGNAFFDHVRALEEV